MNLFSDVSTTVASSFPNYTYEFFSEHQIVSVENNDKKMKFVFSVVGDFVVIDCYYHNNDENDYFWSSPVQNKVHCSDFTSSLLQRIQNEFKLKNLFV